MSPDQQAAWIDHLQSLGLSPEEAQRSVAHAATINGAMGLSPQGTAGVQGQLGAPNGQMQGTVGSLSRLLGAGNQQGNFVVPQKSADSNQSVAQAFAPPSAAPLPDQVLRRANPSVPTMQNSPQMQAIPSNPQVYAPPLDTAPAVGQYIPSYSAGI